jgi:hypothetical protein
MLQKDVSWRSEPGDRLYEINGPNKAALTTYFSNESALRRSPLRLVHHQHQLAPQRRHHQRRLAAHPPT